MVLTIITSSCKDHLLNKSVCTKIKSHRFYLSSFHSEIEFTFPLVCTFLFFTCIIADDWFKERKVA